MSTIIFIWEDYRSVCYKRRMSVDLYQGNCLLWMHALPDASVDLVLCDLPYGTTQNKWDSVIPFGPLWDQYKRVCKGAIVLTAAQPFTSALVMSNVKDFKYQWVWEKPKATGHLNAKKKPMMAHEDVLVFCDGLELYNPQKIQGDKPASNSKGKSKLDTYGDFGEQRTNNTDGTRYPRTVLKINNAEFEGKTHHPTQKPVALMEYLIRTYTNPGDTVLDNCMGSGTTGVACVNTGRKFIGIEQDYKYFGIARERITCASRSYEVPSFSAEPLP